MKNKYDNLLRRFPIHGPLLTNLIQQLAEIPPKKPLKGHGSDRRFWDIKLHGSKRLHDQNSVRQAIFLDLLSGIAPEHVDIYMSYTGRCGRREFFAPSVIVSPEAESVFKNRVAVGSPKLVDADNEWLRVELDLKPVPVILAA